jgi:hypothetical protein
VSRAAQEYLAVLDEAAFGAATPVPPKFISAYSDEAGRGFRFEAGRRSEAKPATIPI